MQRLKVLYVDDHIPDDSLPDKRDEIKKTLKKRYPDWSDKDIEEWTKVYYFAREVINTLGEAYDVTTASKHQDAMTLAENSHFDIAIVDVGWFNDERRKKRPNVDNAGWEICAKIAEADRKLQRRPTLQIAYSSRFVDKPQLSSDAIDQGILPFFKTYEDSNSLALKAVVKFLEKHLSGHSTSLERISIKAVEDFHQMTLESFQESQMQLGHWSILTLVFVAMSLFLVLAGAVSAIFGNAQVGTLTSVSSIITGAISSLLFVQLQRTQKTVTDSQTSVIGQYKEAIERLYGTAATHTQETASSEAKSSPATK